MSGSRVAVIVASYGRPLELAHLLDRLALQTLRPTQVILAVCEPTDAPDALPRGLEVDIVVAPKGLPAQRNAGLRELRSCDYVAFFDDDYVPSRRAVEGIVSGFEALQDLAGLNGRLLADGINGPGISQEEAVRLVEEHDAAWTPRPPMRTSPHLLGLYGCNMAFRNSAIDGARFDERLPLYAWQEDVDFASRLRKAGGMARTDAFYGVHRGVKNGRTSGYRFGYSQVVNPLYLARKGSVPWKFAVRLLLRNVASNAARSLAPEPWIDRRGRLRGNLRAAFDLARGIVDPEAVLEL